MQKKIVVYVFFCIIFFVFSIRLYINKRHDLMQLLEDHECWKKHFIKLDKHYKYNDKKFSKETASFIPSTIEEAPIGQIPSVPKLFLIEEEDFCSKRKLKVIAYVHSAIKNVVNRQITRNTWASSTEAIGTVFIVGKVKNEEEQKIVDKESTLYHDIVQGNYTDLYQLLTYKALNSMYWLKKNCAHVPWVIHADDDIIIDVHMLLNTIHNLDKKHRKSEIFCHTYFRPVVNREGKWLMERSEFPCNSYPVYCAGPMWFSSMNVIKKLFKYIPNVKYLWVDDAYITGLLAEVSDIKRFHMNFKLHFFNENELGKQIAWINVIGNRTKIWKSIVSYYL